MEQSISWLIQELRDTAQVLWYNGSVLIVIAACALATVTWFSLRRS
jgi:hypothetical protein